MKKKKSEFTGRRKVVEDMGELEATVTNGNGGSTKMSGLDLAPCFPFRVSLYQLWPCFSRQ